MGDGRRGGLHLMPSGGSSSGRPARATPPDRRRMTLPRLGQFIGPSRITASSPAARRVRRRAAARSPSSEQLGLFEPAGCRACPRRIRLASAILIPMQRLVARRTSSVRMTNLRCRRGGSMIANIGFMLSVLACRRLLPMNINSFLCIAYGTSLAARISSASDRSRGLPH